MANMGGWLKATLKRWLTYLVGVVVILAILAIGGFYMAKPYLVTFAEKEMASRGIKATSTDISLPGNINLTDVKLPVPAGINLKIGTITGRPPVAFLPGSFTIYDVDLQKDNIHLQIPKISIGGVSLKDKNTSIESHVLQALMRIGVSSVEAPNMLISLTNSSGETEKLDVKGFWLSGLKNGTINSVGIQGMGTDVSLGGMSANNNNTTRLVGKSNAMEARDIDIGYAYSILAGKIAADGVGRTVIGPVALGDVNVDVFEDKNSNAHFSLGSFKTSGLKMRPMKQTPEELVKSYLDAKKAGDTAGEKAARNTLIATIVSSITSVDAEINKADIDLPVFKGKLESFKLKPREWNQPVPESLVISLNGLAVDTSRLPSKDMEIFKTMGFDTLDLSGKLDFSYQSGNKALSLNSLSFDAKGIGSGEMSAKVIDVAPALFSGEKEQTLAASQQLGITEMDMRYSDYGFIDKFFTYLAQSLNDSKHDLKQELYDDFYLIMTQSPALLLKDHGEAAKISDAFGAFAKKPGTLTISVRAKDAKGLTATDLEAALQNDLGTALNKVDLIVKSQ